MSPLGSFSRLAAIVFACTPMVAPAEGQVSTVDEGTFSLFIGGERVGREDFSIRATPGPRGSSYVAQGISIRGEGRLTVALNADSAGMPVRFQAERFEGDQRTASFSGEQERGIWSGRALTARGTSAREFRLSRSTFALEAEVAHLRWFLVRFGEGDQATALLPSVFALQRVEVRDAGPDRVALGLRQIVARRWEVRGADGRVLEEVWTDRRGRLLRVRIAVTGFEALRDEPPVEIP